MKSTSKRIIVLFLFLMIYPFSQVQAVTPVACLPEPTDMPIDYGDTIECTLEVAGDSDIFRLDGLANEIVVVQVADGNGSNPFPIVTVDVLDPSGANLVSTTSRDTITLPVSGTYTFIVSELQDDQPTGYNLAIERVAPTPSEGVIPICYGCTESARIAPYGDMDIISFDGSEGDLVSVQISDGNGSNPFPVVRMDLYDPVGGLVGVSDSQIDTTLGMTGEYTVVVYERDRDQELNYNLTVQCIVGPCLPDVVPVCNLELSQAAYVTGETVRVEVIRLANPGPDPVAVELKWWFELPDGSTAAGVNDGADGSVVLPAGYDQDFGPQNLFAVTAAFPTGTYGFHCRLLDPVTGGALTLDLNPFDINPSP